MGGNGARLGSGVNTSTGFSDNTDFSSVRAYEGKMFTDEDFLIDNLESNGFDVQLWRSSENRIRVGNQELILSKSANGTVRVTDVLRVQTPRVQPRTPKSSR